MLVTGDGRYTYLAPDIAYHLDKFGRGFDRLINIWGADHHGYVPRMKAAVAALGYDPDRLELIITQMVNLSRGGEPVRMSTRAGEFVTFRKVIEEVGADAARYYLVAVSPDTTLNFDLEEAKRQSMENPVYYLQYAHARVRSLEEFAAATGVVRRPAGGSRPLPARPTPPRSRSSSRPTVWLRRWRKPPPGAPRTASPPTARTSPRPSTSSTPTAASSPTTPGSPRPGSGWPRRPRACWLAVLGLLGLSAPDRHVGPAGARRGRYHRAPWKPSAR